MQKLLLTATFMLCCLSSAVSGAADEGVTPDAATAVPAAEDQLSDDDDEDAVPFSFIGSTGRMLDDMHEFLSVRLVDYINRVDTFFGDERIEEETLESYARFGYGVITEPDGSMENFSRLKINLHMPRMERHLNLMIETDRGSEYEAAGTEAAEDTVFAGEKSDVSTALRYLWLERKNWKASADAGLIFGDPIDKFVRGRFRRYIQGSRWNTRITETLFWYDSRGVGESTVLDVEARAGFNNVFRSSTEATWTRDNDYFDLSQRFNLFHEVDARHVVVFQAAAYGVTEPVTRVETYVFNMRGRRRLSREWVFFEVKPQLRFRRDDSFRLEPSLTFLLEAYFGNY